MRQLIYRLLAASATRRAHLWKGIAADLPPGENQDWCLRKAGLALALSEVYRKRAGQ